MTEENEKLALDSFVLNNADSQKAWNEFCDSEKGKSDAKFDSDVWAMFARAGNRSKTMAIAIELALPDCHC